MQTTNHYNESPRYHQKDKKVKEHAIFGIHAIIEAIRAKQTPISKLWVKSNTKHQALKELLQLAHEHQIPCSKVPLVKLNRLTQKNHQGAIAFLSPIPFVELHPIVQYAYEQGKHPLVILLDNVQDLHNLGAIARTALATQVDAIVIGTKESAPINGSAMKASAGALAHIPVCRVNDFSSTIQELQQSGLQIVACSEKATKTCYETNLAGPIALLLGSEGKGISPKYLAQADIHMSIPMHGPIASLNLSVATGVILYEVVRQQSSLARP